MKNEDKQATIDDINGRFHIITANSIGEYESIGSYSRRRDAVRAAERKGFEVV